MLMIKTHYNNSKDEHYNLYQEKDEWDLDKFKNVLETKRSELSGSLRNRDEIVIEKARSVRYVCSTIFSRTLGRRRP